MQISRENVLRCLIIEDEISSQSVLKHFIAETAGLKLVASCSHAAEAFEVLQKHKNIDLLFLDINMPQESGLDFYKRLVNPPPVIFTTAYPQYAVTGFELAAKDYLLKPISYERFLKAIDRVFDNIKPAKKEFILLNENKVLHKVSFQTITHVEAFGDYVKVYTPGKTITTLSTFTHFTDSLPEYFLRVHKSFSVNINSISQLVGNQLMLEKHTIPIGKTYKTAVLERLSN